MRKLIFIGFILVGAVLGLALAVKAPWGARLVIMGPVLNFV